MTRILELAPVFAAADSTEFVLVQGIWNSREQARRIAAERGHDYVAPADGGLDREALDAVLAGVEALVLAPTVAAATGSAQPADGERAGRLIGDRLLARIDAERPDLHIVLVSHFLVGHGVTHRNSKASTWALRALEAQLRGGRNPWTILRPTWLSTIHDPSYQTRLTRDPHADGLVSTQSLAAAVLGAIEHPYAATGRTAAVFDLSIPETGSTDLVAQFGSLPRDFEADAAVSA